MKRRSFLSSLCLGLAGCSILPERPPIKLYGLLTDYTPPTLYPGKKILSSVRVNSPMLASPYDSKRLYVMGADNRMFSTDSSNFSARPSTLIGESFRSFLEVNGPWKTVLAPNSISTPCYQLTIYVNKFFVDAAQDPYSSIIQLEVSLISTESGQLLFHKSYGSKEEIKTKNMSGCITALEDGLKKIYANICWDLNSKASRL